MTVMVYVQHTLQRLSPFRLPQRSAKRKKERRASSQGHLGLLLKKLVGAVPAIDDYNHRCSNE